jgi:hypothetical protein
MTRRAIVHNGIYFSIRSFVLRRFLPISTSLFEVSRPSISNKKRLLSTLIARSNSEVSNFDPSRCCMGSKLNKYSERVAIERYLAKKSEPREETTK